MQVWAYLPEIILPVILVKFFFYSGGSGEWVWGVSQCDICHIFGGFFLKASITQIMCP